MYNDYNILHIKYINIFVNVLPDLPMSGNDNTRTDTEYAANIDEHNKGKVLGM